MSASNPAFSQYADLYREVGESRPDSPFIRRINRAGAEAYRAAADAFRHDPMGIPETEADRMLAPDYGVNVMRVDLPVDAAAAFHCGVPSLNSYLAVIANDAFHPTPQLLRNVPEGLTVCSLRDVPERLQDIVFDNIRSRLTDIAVCINAMMLSDGVLVYVESGVKVEKAVQIVNISNPATPMLAPRCVVVIAREGAEVKVLLCDHSQTRDVEHMSLESVIVSADADAKVELYDIEEGTVASRRRWQLYARQADRSELTVNTTCLNGGVTRNNYVVDVAGDYTSTRLSGLAICTGSQIADNHVVLTHSGKHCTSRQVFKNALFDASRGGFSGRIIVDEGAVFTDADQSNRNLLLGDEARMTGAPQLEIYCDEVKCSHGATTGQLDERAIFYMQSRGIPREEARRMLTQTFMGDVVDTISFEVLRQRIHVLVEKRLSGAETDCNTCATACKNQTELPQ